MAFSLSSTAFEHAVDIPDIYTCRGENVSPPVSWNGTPEGTKSFALIAEDLDTPVGIITHWVIFNIPPEKRGLEEAIPVQERFTDGTIQGKNMMRRNGYMGPCPPWGRHRYYFRVFALDTVLDPDSSLTKKKLRRAMETHILAQADLMGYYSKKKSL